MPLPTIFTHYKLDDGRLWDVAAGRFASSGTHDVAWKRPVGPDGKTADEEGLRFCLKFFGYPLGDMKTDEDYAAEARAKRNALIAETDYMAMPDYPLDDERKTAVMAYRQALRDVPEQVGFPRQIDWPVKP
jgi:hypothetical protein